MFDLNDFMKQKKRTQNSGLVLHSIIT